MCYYQEESFKKNEADIICDNKIQWSCKQNI